MIDKVVTDAASECQHESPVLLTQQTNKIKPVLARKKLVKKGFRRNLPIHTVNGKNKACSYDRLPNSNCKKAKINGKTNCASVQSENDCDASSSVPSLASDLSGDGKKIH